MKLAQLPSPAYARLKRWKLVDSGALVFVHAAERGSSGTTAGARRGRPC